MTAIGSRIGSDWNEGALEVESFVAPKVRGGLFYVYVAWGELERPLYVGKSNQPAGRIGEHYMTSKWARQAQRFDLYAFATAQEASSAESKAIAALDPIYNIIRSSGHNLRPRNRRRPTPRLWVRRLPPIEGFSAEQSEIIRRIQNRGKAP